MRWIGYVFILYPIVAIIWYLAGLLDSLLLFECDLMDIFLLTWLIVIVLMQLSWLWLFNCDLLDSFWLLIVTYLI